MSLSPLDDLEAARVPTVERMHAVLSLPGMRALGTSSLASMAASMAALRVPAGAVVGRAGRALDHAVIVLDGELVAQRPESAAVTIGPWRSAGTLAMLARDPQGVAIQARRDSVVLALTHGDFEEIAEDTFEILRHSLAAIASAVNTTRMRAGPTAGFGPPSVATAAAATLDLAERMLVLRRIPSVGSAPLDILAEIARAAQVRHIAGGEPLFTEGEAANTAFILVDGQVRGANAQGQAFRFGPGDACGITCATAGTARWYTATADSDCRVMAVERDVFIDLYEDHCDYGLLALRGFAGSLIALSERASGTEARSSLAVT